MLKGRANQYFRAIFEAVDSAVAVVDVKVENGDPFYLFPGKGMFDANSDIEALA